MTLETGYLSSRQVIDQSNGCQASGFATGRAARQISKIGVRRQGHTGMGLKILSREQWALKPHGSCENRCCRFSKFHSDETDTSACSMMCTGGAFVLLDRCLWSI